MKLDARLSRAAQPHSEDMAAHNYFDHTSLDGRTVVDRGKAQGYPSTWGENIAKGQNAPADVRASWMSSEGHRTNILNCDHTTMGLGLAWSRRAGPGPRCSGSDALEVSAWLVSHHAART
ncbi:CAP domain-containing protein [Streptomyces asiaticus]|uniref:CAP domain-containing protein n=1 Tax=Streptomyces asiaticus TaxID=114695 RepID=UPI003F67AD4A